MYFHSLFPRLVRDRLGGGGVSLRKDNPWKTSRGFFMFWLRNQILNTPMLADTPQKERMFMKYVDIIVKKPVRPTWLQESEKEDYLSLRPWLNLIACTASGCPVILVYTSVCDMLLSVDTEAQQKDWERIESKSLKNWMRGSSCKVYRRQLSQCLTLVLPGSETRTRYSGHEKRTSVLLSSLSDHQAER